MGLPDRPTTLRLALREEYRPNLETAVRDNVPRNYDLILARRLLDPGPSGDDEDLWSAGLSLPEDEVRAVLGVLEDGDAEWSHAAATWLDRRGELWNAERHAPPAPRAGMPRDRQATAWRAWSKALVGSFD